MIDAVDPPSLLKYAGIDFVASPTKVCNPLMNSKKLLEANGAGIKNKLDEASALSVDTTFATEDITTSCMQGEAPYPAPANKVQPVEFNQTYIPSTL
jgi:hypothetical protein